MCSVEQRVGKTKRKEEAERLKPSRKTSSESPGPCLCSPSGSQQPLHPSLTEREPQNSSLPPFSCPPTPESSIPLAKGMRWRSHLRQREVLGFRWAAPLGGRVWCSCLWEFHKGENVLRSSCEERLAKKTKPLTILWSVVWSWDGFPGRPSCCVLVRHRTPLGGGDECWPERSISSLVHHTASIAVLLQWTKG